SLQKEKESETLQQLIISSEKQSSNPRIQKQVHTLKQKLEEIQSSQEVYVTCKELNSYHLEGSLELESDSVEFLLERYRTYQVLLDSLDESESSLAKTDIEAIMDIYYTKILEIIAETGVDKKYGFGTAEARPLSLEKLSHLINPDTENPEFIRYRERAAQITQGNSRLLTDGQKITMQDDLKGAESERIVTEELSQVPGVLATIDIPKFSIGDTRHKADTIAITLNPELVNSITDEEIQLAVYTLIEEYRKILLENMVQQGENSLINPKDNILGNIIRVNRNIKLDNIAANLKEKDIDLSQILRIHKIQIKTQASEMSRAAESYATSKVAVDADKVGFLAREYHHSGDPQAEEFNRVHFQIAAQTVLGLSIK
ncbi:MAG: hypothetical protein RJB24_669, partial [Candidatus Parcubacteria bacterium]